MTPLFTRRHAVLASLIALLGSHAHASITVSASFSDIVLTTTTAEGLTTTWLPGVSAQSGNPGWHTRLGALTLAPDDLTPTSVLAEPLQAGGTVDVSQSSTLGTLAAQARDTATGIAYSTTFTSAPPLPPVAAGVRPSDFLVNAGMTPSVVFDPANWDQQAPVDLGELPVDGGIWLAAGASATITGMAAQSGVLRGDDLGVDPAKVSSSISSELAVSLIQVDEGGTINALDPFGPEYLRTTVLEASASINRLENRPGVDAPVQRFDQAAPFSISVTNTAAQGRWLLVGSTVNIYGYEATYLSVPGGLIPEPGTWALMVLGLCAVAAAARAQRQ